MRSSGIKLFLSVLFVVCTIRGFAQECTGSLGDPVFKEDFGSGTNPGAALGDAVTNYPYVNTDCPNDGTYTIINRTTGCFSAWRTMTDHTGNPNGYFMLINASSDPGLFYTQAVPAGRLCPGTQYEFSAYINNVLLPSGCDGNGVKPNLTFTVEKPDGTPIDAQPANTGDVPSVDQGQDGWIKYSTYFTTPVDVTNVVVKIINNKPGGNACGNDLALDDITFRACGPIIYPSFDFTNGKTEQDFCVGDNKKAILTAKAYGNPVYQWQYNTGADTWADIQGENSDTYTRPANNGVAGTYLYRVGVVANGNDITTLTCRTYSSTLAVVVNSPPTAPAIPPQSFCEGTTLTLTASGGATYLWTGPGITPTTQNPLVINNVALANAGTYHVVPVSAQQCSGATVDVQVNITPKVTAVVSDDVPVCAGQSTQLTASGGLYYKWTPSAGLDHDDIASPIATPLVTTTYHVNVSNDACNDDTKSITVTVRQNPVADGGGDKKIFEGQSVKLNGTVKGDEITSVSWYPATALDNPLSATPTASPTDDITYTMTVTSLNCGISTSPVFVRVYKKITIPNTFSPNNDGINDLWNIEALFTYPESSVLVFNRYGQKVFQSTGYSKPWDGTYNGSTLPQGTYYYIIDLKNNTPRLTGWVLLVK